MYEFYARGYELCCALPKSWDKDEPREMAFVADKQLSIQTHKAYMLSRLLQMFEYKNLPETIPQEMLELQMLLQGYSFITEVHGDLYAVIGTPGGEPDPYYRPTKFVWANPALKESREDDLWNDGILMRNDRLWIGLSPLINKYAAILAENEITIRVADIMLRIVAMITSPDDNTKVAADEYLKRILNGRLGSMAENRFFDGIKMQSPPTNNGSYLTQFIELQQYMKASFFNEVGMQANYNMKRENLGSAETAMNQNSTLPLCDQMLATRREDLSRLNAKYNLNITIDYTSAWKLNAEELKLEIEQLKAEIDATRRDTPTVPVSGIEGGDNPDDDGSESQNGASDDKSTYDGASQGESRQEKVDPAEESRGETREERQESRDKDSESEKGVDSGSGSKSAGESGENGERSDVAESSGDSAEDSESDGEKGGTTSDEDSGDGSTNSVVSDEEGVTVNNIVVIEFEPKDGDDSAEGGDDVEVKVDVSQLSEEEGDEDEDVGL